MALLISMMALSVLTALAATLVLGTMTETAVASSYREGIETFYAAEAAVEFVIQDLAAASDWEGIVGGGTELDLCGRPTSRCAAGGCCFVRSGGRN